MSRSFRLLLAVVCFIGIFASVALLAWPVLLAITLAAFLLHVRWVGTLRLGVHKAAPVIGFAMTVTFLQWCGGRRPPLLGLQTLYVFQLLSLLMVPFAPGGIALPRRSSRFYKFVLYILFVRHFAAIGAGEVHRVVRAHRMFVGRRLGPQAMQSLAHALNSIAGRCLMRAERFYAAQWLRGLDD